MRNQNSSPFETSTAGETLPSRPAHLRQANARCLLRLLREHNPCSKADLVRRSGLSAPTVSSAIGHLESLGLIEKLGDGESNGGRPPEMLRFRADRGYVAGVDIGGTRLRMMLTDLNGKLLSQWAHQFTEEQRTPEGVCCLINEGLKLLCDEAGCSVRKVLHLTAGAPGITNVDSGVVLSAPNLKNWNDVPLRAMLEKETGVSVLVENDTNLAAVGEYWRGAARGVGNFVFIAIGTGIGSGIFLQDNLHRGANWSAGEIGYLGVFGLPSEPLHFRSMGQLESHIGGHGLEREWLRLLDQHGRSGDPILSRLRATEVFDLAAEGDRLAAEVVEFAAKILAYCISSLALVLDPELVILGGGIGSHDELRKVTEKYLEQNEFARPRLHSSALGTQAQLHGAVSLSLSAVESRLLALDLTEVSY